MDWAIYLISLFALAAALWQAGRLAGALRLPRVLTVGLAGCTLVYLASLVCGAAAAYRPVPVGVALTILSAATAALLWRCRPAVAATLAPSGIWAGPWNPGALLVCLLMLPALYPLAKFGLSLRTDLLNPAVHINYDGVSYHLPTLVDYAQRGTLWYTGGPFASYSYAYELVYGYPMLFVHEHWSLVLMNALTTLMAAAAVMHLGRTLVRAANRMIGGSDAGPLNPMVAALVALGLWSLHFGQNLDDLGKNDVFVCATLVGALALVLDWAMEADRSRARALLVTAIAALGLAVGTKATALLFAPLLAGVALVAGLGSAVGADRPRIGRGLGAAILLGAGSLAIGGFWYARNIVLFGHIVEPGNERGFKMSLWHNIADGRMYQFHKYSFVVAVTLLSPVVLFVLGMMWKRRTRQRGSGGGLVVTSLLLFQLAGLGIMLITPFFLFRDRVWFTRLGIVQMSVAAVVYGAMLAYLASRLGRSRWSGPASFGHAASRLASGRVAGGLATMILLGLAIVLPWRWDQKHVWGMPTDDLDRRKKRLPTTQVYHYIQHIGEPKRIYAAGLRPYGLYGRNWQHTLWYDSHGHVLDGRKPLFNDPDALFYDSWQDLLASGTPMQQTRLLTILKYFKPDLLVLGVEADQDFKGAAPPLSEWLDQQPWAVQVMRDDVAVVYKVMDGWQALLDQYPIPPALPKMHW